MHGCISSLKLQKFRRTIWRNNYTHIVPVMSVAIDPLVAAEQQIINEHQLREKVVNEEFKIWKKTVPLLYNSIHTHALKWPLLTVDFSPNYIFSDDKKSVEVVFVTGSNTSSREQDSVTLRSIKLPATLAPDFSLVSTSDSIPIPTTGTDESDLSIKRLWTHQGEVNRAKFSPSGERFVTFDNAGVVHLYSVNEDSPIDFKHHKTEGYCLEWISENQFLSGANDTQVALWNVSSPGAPSKQFNTHTAVVNDISYSKPTGVLFASVSDDYSTQIHDLRSSEDSPAIQIVERHLQNAVQFHPEISHLFATGGKDNVVNLYDARSTKNPIRQLFGHNDLIFGLRWDNSDPSQLYSWGLDKRVISWDLNFISEDYSPPNSESTELKKRSKHSEDPCLRFIHAGHTNRVNDLAVHPKIPNLFATVGDDTLLEIYQPKTLEEGEEDEHDEDDIEDENADENDNETENGMDKNDESENERGGESEYEKTKDSLGSFADRQGLKVDDGMQDDTNEKGSGHLDKAAPNLRNSMSLNSGPHAQYGINNRPAQEEENSNSDVEMAD